MSYYTERDEARDYDDETPPARIKVITAMNAYTRAEHDLCVYHYEHQGPGSATSRVVGDCGQVQYGLHDGHACDVCEALVAEVQS